VTKGFQVETVVRKRRKIASSDDGRKTIAGIDAGRQQRFQGDLTKERLNSIMGGSAGQGQGKMSHRRSYCLGAKALAISLLDGPLGQELTTSRGV
jgi:hypothetical protein